MKTLQKGFTLIELMIVVAIIGILAAVALPMYQDFQVRSKMSEVIGAMGACKTSVTEFYSSNNGWTTATGVAIDPNLCQTASQYVASVAVGGGGIITATTSATGRIGGNPTAENRIITMEPLDGANAAVTGAVGQVITQWRCGGAAAGTTVPAKYRPGSCQG